MHNIKIKNMKCENSSIIAFKKYAMQDFTYKTFKGKSSLGVIKQIKPIYGNRNGKQVSLNDEDCLWLQIGFEELPYWLTGLYNKDKKLIEFYFDITKNNNMKLENPIFYDMYLDVVYTANKEIILLDKDEFEEAFQDKIITEEEYSKAKQSCQELIQFLKENGDEVIKVCNIEVDKLYKLLK